MHMYILLLPSSYLRMCLLYHALLIVSVPGNILCFFISMRSLLIGYNDMESFVICGAILLCYGTILLCRYGASSKHNIFYLFCY
jgi:hypothetical protein